VTGAGRWWRGRGGASRARIETEVVGDRVGPTGGLLPCVGCRAHHKLYSSPCTEGNFCRALFNRAHDKLFFCTSTKFLKSIN
jgi:hypothetical protein